MEKETNNFGLGDIELSDLEPSLAYLTEEGFIEWFFDRDGELCLRLSEGALEMQPIDMG